MLRPTPTTSTGGNTRFMSYQQLREMLHGMQGSRAPPRALPGAGAVPWRR